MKKTFQLIQVLDNLSRIPRSGGVLFSGINPNLGDTIAEHSYKVVWLTLLLAEKVKKEGIEVDEAALLKTAITHDWSESVLLDIPSGSPSYKSYFADVDFREIVKKAEAKVNAQIKKFVEDEIDLSIYDDKLSDKEKAIFKAADITASLLEILEWRYHGLRYEWFDYMWSNTLKRMEDLIEESVPEIEGIITELEEAYEKDEKPPNPFLTKSKFQSFKK